MVEAAGIEPATNLEKSITYAEKSGPKVDDEDGGA